MNSVLKAIFPFLATAAGTVGGPLGAAAANALGKALGCDKENPTVDELSGAYAKATPEQITAAKAEEHAFQLKMQEANINSVLELERVAAADRASAREREVKANDSWTPRILAAVVVTGWIVIQWFLLRHVIASEMRDIIMRMLGTLDAALTLVLAYYFGSSAGSARKTDMLARAEPIEDK